MIKVDLTRSGDREYDRLLRKFDVKGVPTVVFLDRNGTERRDLRLVDYLPPDQFLIRMAEARKAHSESSQVENSRIVRNADNHKVR